MDAERLEFPDRSFDAVLCAFGIFFLPDMEGALGEMLRVCKPGGYIGVSVFGQSPPLFAPAWPMLAEQFRAYGVGTAGVERPIAFAPEEVEALLTRCGFGCARTLSETSDAVYASAEDWWAFLLSVGTRGTIVSMDEEMRARFKDEYLEGLRPLFRKDGLHLPVSVVYTVAQR
jgi:SAM-dependent methyltransferase